MGHIDETGHRISPNSGWMAKSAGFCIFENFLFLAGFNCVLTDFFPEFYWIFKNSTGSLGSDFYPPVEFVNPAHRHHPRAVSFANSSVWAGVAILQARQSPLLLHIGDKVIPSSEVLHRPWRRSGCQPSHCRACLSYLRHPHCTSEAPPSSPSSAARPVFFWGSRVTANFVLQQDNETYVTYTLSIHPIFKIHRK
jgi:hypothetical protein